MLTIAYIGNGKSTNRYHLPFSTKLKDKIKVKTIYSPSGRITWEKIQAQFILQIFMIFIMTQKFS